MNRNVIRILLIVASLLTLAMMLSYPFGPDQSVAAVGGELSVRHGAIAYSDFIDTRPQIIFWIYGLASLLFGHHAWSIRLFDILYHIAALYIFYSVLRRFIKDDNVAFVSVIVYIVFYVASGFDNTAEAETFALLPGILLFYFTEKAALNKGGSILIGICAGICAGILFLLKFTFLAAGFTAILYLVLNRNLTPRSVFKYCIGFTISIIVLAGLYIVLLYLTGSLPRFLQAMHWLQGYSKGSYGSSPNEPSGGVHFKMFPGGLLLEYGMTFVVLLCISIVVIVKQKPGLPVGYTHLCLQVLAGLLVVYYEGKSWNYHYARFAFAAVPLIGFGIVYMLHAAKELFVKWKGMNYFQSLLRVAIIMPVVALAIFYSPLIRIWKFPVRLSLMRLRGENIDQTIQDDLTGYFYKEQTATSDLLSPLLEPNDQIFLWGRGVGLYFDLNRLPTTICLTSMSMSTPNYTPISWRQNVLHSLEQMPPRFVIVQSDMNTDYSPGLSRSSTLNENRPLEEWQDLYNFVHSNYSEKSKIGHFQIFERNASTQTK